MNLRAWKLCASLIAAPIVLAGLTAVNGGAAAVPVETTTLKPGLRGLVVTQPSALSTVPYADFGSMKLSWQTIETQPGVYDFSAIDAALSQHPDVRFRLRFMAGVNAPTWVKDDAGGCVLIEPDSANGSSGCVARFWTDAYHADYVALMQAVAARYENDPQVVEIANSECTTIFAEPFILGANSASIDRLWQAGYTKQGHDTCLRRSTAAMMSLFRTTRVSLAGHTKWQFIVPGKGGPDDGAFAASWEDERAILNDLGSAYGSRLVLDDHGLGPDDPVCPTPGESRLTATSWYCYMSGLHATTSSYGWQFTLNGGSMATAADAGVAMGACFLEFAAFQALDQTKRRQVHDSLLANCAGTVEDPPIADPTTDPPTTDPTTDPPTTDPTTDPPTTDPTTDPPTTDPTTDPPTTDPTTDPPTTDPTTDPATTDPPPVTDPPVDPSPSPTLTIVSAPKITGVPAVRRTLTASSGTWSTRPGTVTYQWFRGSTAIAGATGPTYTVVPLDAGRRLRVLVTATLTGYVSGHATSSWVRVRRG